MPAFDLTQIAPAWSDARIAAASADQLRGQVLALQGTRTYLLGFARGQTGAIDELLIVRHTTSDCLAAKRAAGLIN